MTTTPEATKGVPRIVGDPAPSLRADHNATADFLVLNLDSSVANVAALPTTGNWAGRQRLVLNEGITHYHTGSAWVRPKTLIEEDMIPVAGVGPLASASTISTLTFTAFPAQTTILMILDVKAGFAASASTVAVTAVATAGTLTGSTARQVQAPAAQFIGFTQTQKLVLPANTASTVTFRTLSSASAYYDLGGTYRRVTS